MSAEFDLSIQAESSGAFGVMCDRCGFGPLKKENPDTGMRPCPRCAKFEDTELGQWVLGVLAMARVK